MPIPAKLDPMTVPWSAQINDLIGGWCVTPAGMLRPAQGALLVADFCNQEMAEHIANLHNDWLAKQ